MIGVLTHHWAKVDKIDEARKVLDRNGDAQSKAPGTNTSVLGPSTSALGTNASA